MECDPLIWGFETVYKTFNNELHLIGIQTIQLSMSSLERAGLFLLPMSTVSLQRKVSSSFLF